MSKQEPPRPRWDSGGTAVQQTLRAIAGQGFDPEDASEIVTSVSRIVAEALSGARGQRGVIDAMRTTVGLASRVVRGARERTSLPVLPSACADGCSHCCRVYVSISAPEAIVLAAFLRDTLDTVALATLTAHVEATAKSVAAMDRDARLASKVPCPLLDGDRCVAYPVRPLPCAAVNSYDASACASGGEIPIDPIQLGAVRATQIGLSTAIAARGLDHGRYELAGALAVTLRTKDAAERWLVGERLFTSTAGDAAETKITEVAHAFASRDPHLARAAIFK
jgi:Fe-S-cluster containining protein